MASCPSCGFEYTGDFRFCPNCATPLDGSRRTVAEERKVVTSLFCDLVGFTALSEAADPEDVDRMLGAYFLMARSQVEAFGGTVEKFIGDAVVGVFGVPAAHEDDPERAIRAGLAICEQAESLTTVGGEPLRLRVGINTGEALVRLGVSAASGEGFLTGDSINTASRIQAVAPEMGVAVGLATHDATARIFDYEELAPASLKGKADPIRVFHAKGPRARVGTDLTRTHDTPFVGREIDLAILKGVFAKTVAASSPQLVIVNGEPGLGKSRIVAELSEHIAGLPELVNWRQGRCLPYGRGITFWALGEIVKAHAGILESDRPEAAVSKLDRVLPEGEELPWFRQRLLPLLGIEASSPAGREELFTAWRRFLESVAQERPTVLVFEDLHWADDAMLAFLEHLAEHADRVPLLIVGTARPELYERHGGFAGSLRNATSINLAPLSDEETTRLVSGLLSVSVVPPELLAPIVERASGNPLFAEEFVRLLRDRELIAEGKLGWELIEGAEVPFPDTVQALIAARLDALSPEAKSVLAAAAVVGKVFWAGAVAEVDERDVGSVTEVLRELGRKELVHPSRPSTIEGEAEYAFRHVLARDVAYGQLPRAPRATRHVAAARWIESITPERTEDLADVLAYHYATALELSRAVGEHDQARTLAPSAFRFLSLAGERALGLDAEAALANLERALELAPTGDPARGEALARFGEAALQAGRPTDAVGALEEAVSMLRAQGDVEAAAGAMGTLALALGVTGDGRAWELPSEALALLEPLGPSPALVRALAEVTRVHAIQGRFDEAIRVADRAIELAEQVALPRPGRAIGYRGFARSGRGDPSWREDVDEAIALATRAGEGREVALLIHNLATALWVYEGPVASLEASDHGTAYARPRGLSEMDDSLAAGSLDLLVDAGRGDTAFESYDELVTRLDASGDVWDLIDVRCAYVRAATLRGEAARVEEDAAWLEDASRSTHDVQLIVQGLVVPAAVRVELGQEEAARSLLTEVEALPTARDNAQYCHRLPTMVRTALRCGDRALAERLVDGYEARYPYAEHALVASHAAIAEARGDLETAAVGYADAAERWERFAVAPEQGYALLGHGRSVARGRRPADAAPVLERARRIFERLHAAPAVAEVDALLVEIEAGREGASSVRRSTGT